MTKRLFDIVVSACALAIASPLLLLAAVLIKLDSRGSVLFAQERIGRGFRPFRILKLRSMAAASDTPGLLITTNTDKRITRVGRILRKAKLDELPQLVNVLRGEMSLVGPRPEVLKYVELFRGDYAEILTVRPGITDLASVRYRNEEAVLAAAADPEREYVERVLPEKIRLGKEYIAKQSLLLDVRILLDTLLVVVAPRRSSRQRTDAD